MYGQGGSGLLNSNSIICSLSIFPSFFFIGISLRKNWQSGGELLLKNSTIWLRILIMLLLGPDLQCAGPLKL